MENYYIYQLVSLILLLLVAIFAILIPGIRSRRRLKEDLMALSSGSKVCTRNGLLGYVESVSDDAVILSVEPSGIRLEVAKWGIREVLKE
ncbi:MAG: preprotein translocase subunit YajC [Eubacteriales bacterium]|nr:preprotein translocase subunit YajC [Eubacteriales bacterium]